MTGQDIHSENIPSLSQHKVNIETNIPDLKLTFYLLTPEQIDAYSDMGRLFDLSATISGIIIGAIIGFWTALKQGGLSPESIAILHTSLYLAIIFGCILILASIWFFIRKGYLKKQWRTSTLSPSKKQ